MPVNSFAILTFNMFSRVFAIATVIVTLSVQAQAHAVISPALGVTGTPQRLDAQIPLKVLPCGLKANIAGDIDTATPVVAAANGSFAVTITNFNP